MASQLQAGIADTCSVGTIVLGLAAVDDIKLVDLDMSRHEAGRPDAQVAELSWSSAAC
ncbi:uncharacterized protein TrAtP1_010207 [Trichoderma atroviride]|uniref:uncharacterized protein n=1 Tax=Hypocrea atroviridis TaxID=63577 RepID=UPI00331F7674|nr:hypothetical protein TrAtP1_010207 [Trichoderma atroviride]